MGPIYEFPFVSSAHEEFFHQAVHETGAVYPPTVVALYLLSACAEVRENFWEVVDPDGCIKDDRWDCWQDEDRRRCVALTVDLTGGGSYPVLSPAYIYDTPLPRSSGRRLNFGSATGTLPERF